MNIASTMRLVAAPPHRAGYPFLAAAAAALLAGLLFAHWLAWLAAIFGAFCLYFFRDPERVPPARTGVVIAPADGRIVAIRMAAPPPGIGLPETPLCCISIFLSVLDVHVNRAPVAGTVTAIAYRHGKFVNAAADKASEDNERNALAILMDDGRTVAVVQIAGLIARRILCHAAVGNRVQAGARFGIIRFGSRTDTYLPPGAAPLVSVGQTMIGGETVLALL
jgi:phosphatidylserine decarboxylase